MKMSKMGIFKNILKSVSQILKKYNLLLKTVVSHLNLDSF